MSSELTILNSMADRDFEKSLDQHVDWGLRWLDLKDCILGAALADLTHEQATRAAEMIRRRGLEVYCFSSQLFVHDVEQGLEAFAARQAGQVERLIALAQVLRPRVIRLLATRTSRRSAVDHSTRYIRNSHPWLIDLYREAIDRFAAEGFDSTIENECHDCIFARPDEIVGFFRLLDRAGKVFFTWDVQNLWQMGTFPTVGVYEQLRDLIGYYHVKGGQSEPGHTTLMWRSALSDASWPVREITRRVIADRRSPVICLNPSHGQPRQGYDYSNIAQRDLDFMRQVLGETP